ncbi:MAG TPA: phenylalanine--tRNA ligase subunit beta [bacterium]|nr:phenylalanine--tRNA ligase subunit beta [bacterium]
MRVPREWLEAYVDLGDVSTQTLVERLATAGFPVDAVEQQGDDAVLDVEVTSNRPDCLSIIGIAREAALLFGRALRLPEGLERAGGVRAVRTPRSASRAGAPSRRGRGRSVQAAKGGPRPAGGVRARISITVEDSEGCPRFTATVFDDVRAGPSPVWMQRRLEAAGVRAINNVVDVTNYVMLEMGQPMHAFDLARVGGRRLIVRRARPGETLVTLDGVTRTVDEQSLVVADATHAVALAGVIGGQDTEIGPQTTAVLLEAAYWFPPGVGRTSRRLGLRTEASSRFERGADPDGPILAQRRADLLLADVAGARLVPGVIDLYPRPLPRAAIRLRPRRAAAVLGVEVPRREMVRILRALGCDVRPGAASLAVRPPTNRPDLTREEDLIEEVIRVYGYDRVPLTMPRGTTTPGRVSVPVAGERRVREALIRSGLTEVMTLTLVAAEPPAAPAGGGPNGAGSIVAAAGDVRLTNPLTVEHAALRRSVLPGLLRVLATNASRRQQDVHVFELGRVWRAGEPGGRPDERRAAGIALMGRWRWGWNVPADSAVADFYHLRAVVDALVQDLGVAGELAVRSSTSYLLHGAAWWHPGRVAVATVAGREVGRLGELHPDLVDRERLPYRPCVAELDLDLLLEAAGPIRTYAGLPRYPEVDRDLAVVLPETLAAAEIERLIRSTAGPLLETVELFDVYAGSPVPAGHRNLAYRLRFRAPDRTLTAAEAEEIMAEIRTALEDQAGGRLRT